MSCRNVTGAMFSRICPYFVKSLTRALLGIVLIETKTSHTTSLKPPSVTSNKHDENNAPQISNMIRIKYQQQIHQKNCTSETTTPVLCSTTRHARHCCSTTFYFSIGYLCQCSNKSKQVQDTMPWIKKHFKWCPVPYLFHLFLHVSHKPI